MFMPTYPNKPKLNITFIQNGMTSISNADSNIKTIWSNTTNETIIYNILIQAIGTNAACVINFYINNRIRLWKCNKFC